MSSFTGKEKAVLGCLYLLEIQVAKLIEDYGQSSQLLVYGTITFFMSICHVIAITAVLPTVVKKHIFPSQGSPSSEMQERITNLLGFFSTNAYYFSEKKNQSLAHNYNNEDSDELDTVSLLSNEIVEE